MHRFRVECIGDSDTILLGEAGQVHHLKDVLRLNTGDRIAVFDDGGHECLCTVDRFSREGAMLTVQSRQKAALTGTKLTVAVAVPKKGMDEIIDKLTQLGVEAIIPMRTERVVVRLGEEGAAGKVERWKRLAQAAAEQSHRRRVPEIQRVTDFAAVLSGSNAFDLKLIPHLSGDRKTLGEVLAATNPISILVLIGPEGDFTSDEVESALKAGFVPVSLGSQVLRVDTAAIAVAAYLRLAEIT